MIITDHAYERAKERMSLNRSAIEHLAAKALTDGIDRKNAKGQLSKYLNNLFEKGMKASKVRVYGEFVYVFTRKCVLLTVHPVPKELKAITIKQEQRKAA